MNLKQLAILTLFISATIQVGAQKKQYYNYETNHVIDSVFSGYPLMDYNGDSIPDKIRIKSIFDNDKITQEIYFIESLNDSVLLKPILVKTIYPQENIAAVLRTNSKTNKIDLIEVKKYHNGIAKELLYKNVNDTLQKPILIGIYDPEGNYTSYKKRSTSSN